VADLTIDAVNVLLAIKRADIKSLKRLLKDDSISKSTVATKLSERWLQFQYGVTPLIKDIYGLVSLYNDGLSDETSTFKLKARSSGSINFDDQWNPGFRNNLILRATSRINASISNTSARGLSLLGLNDPGLILWERVPFSFAVDWFLPIGTILQAQSAVDGLTFETGSFGCTYTMTGSKIWTNPNAEPVECFITLDGFRRDLISSFIDPIVYIKNPLSQAHVLNAAALIQVLRGR
jgi:hypothetical protein